MPCSHMSYEIRDRYNVEHVVAEYCFYVCKQIIGQIWLNHFKTIHLVPASV